MSLFGIGLKFASAEHRWERRTNYVIVAGIIVTGLAYYYNFEYLSLSASELGLFFLVLIGLVHLIARLSHKGEQFFLKSSRPWK
jgi:hypothetical protein